MHPKKIFIISCTVYVGLSLSACSDNISSKNITPQEEIKTLQNTAKTSSQKPQKIQPDYKVALRFVQTYIKNPTKSSALVTENFKKELAYIQAKAWEEDPDIGLGFDPVFNAQDAASDGYFIAEKKGNYVIIRSEQTPVTNVIIKLIQQDNTWLIEGAGIINIPQHMQLND